MLKQSGAYERSILFPTDDQIWHLVNMQSVLHLSFLWANSDE